MKKVLLTAVLLSTVLLSGCLFPEKFTTKIDINSDASYHVVYSGTTAYIPAVIQMAKTKQPLTTKDDTDLKKEAEKMTSIKGVKKSAYLGNGRFDLQVDEVIKANQSLDLFKMIIVSTDVNGIMTIATPKLKPKDVSDIAKLGLTISGTLDVVLPKNAEVISSNATTKPSLFGLLGSYSWKINGFDNQPLMKIKFK